MFDMLDDGVTPHWTQISAKASREFHRAYGVEVLPSKPWLGAASSRPEAFEALTAELDSACEVTGLACTGPLSNRLALLVRPPN
jgi:hypothetical protein